MKTVLRWLLSNYQLGLKMNSSLYLKVEILILLEQECQHVCWSTMPERPGCLPDPIIHCLGPFWLHQDFRLFRKIHSCSTLAQKVTILYFTTLCSKSFSLCCSLVRILNSPSLFFSCSDCWLILIGNEHDVSGQERSPTSVIFLTCTVVAKQVFCEVVNLSTLWPSEF